MTGGSVLSRNCELFLDRLEKAALKCGRKREEIRVIAVAKTRSLEEVRQVISCGFKEIGENKVQEAQSKYADGDRDFRLHMIGHLQTNKARTAAGLFDVFQSVDSIRLADMLNQESERRGKITEVMFEVNTSGEEQKYGFNQEQVLAAADDLFEMQHLSLTGLMTVGPLTDDEENIRNSFRVLRGLFEKLRVIHPAKESFTALSMGMSDDFEIAIAEGSTMIRVGRALFGPRTI